MTKLSLEDIACRVIGGFFYLGIGVAALAVVFLLMRLVYVLAMFGAVLAGGM